MKHYFFSRTAIMIAVLFSLHRTPAQSPFAASIDPTIGNVGTLLEPTRPTASLPNQPVRVYPIRKDYLDDQITCFPLTAVSHRLGEGVAVRPVVGRVQASNWEIRMPYDHDLEITRP